MFEREPQNNKEGYAIVGRFMFKPSTGFHFLERVDLNPGEGVIFKRGKGFKTINWENVYFEMWSSLRNNELASIAFYDNNTGEVVIAGAHDEYTIKISSDLPQDQRAQRLVVDSREYVVVIDTCREVAEEKLPALLNSGIAY